MYGTGLVEHLFGNRHQDDLLTHNCLVAWRQASVDVWPGMHSSFGIYPV